MGFILLAITGALSVFAFRRWVKFLTPRARRSQRTEDLADAVPMEWPGLISFLLPRTWRRAWHAMLYCALWLLLGAPHYLILWQPFRGVESTAWIGVHYLWSLAYWLALLGMPAAMLVNERVRKERERANSPPT